MAEVGLSMPYEARYASSTFAYTAPSSCTCTLSRVIAVCGWIGNVVSLSERLYATLSMNGIAKFSPGEALQRSEAPLSGACQLCAGMAAAHMRWNLPKRSIDHSSA